MEIGILPDSLLSKVGELFSFSFEVRKSGTWEEWIKGEDTLTPYAAFDNDQLYALVCVHDFFELTTGFWQRLPANRPAKLGRIAGAAPTFISEIF